MQIYVKYFLKQAFFWGIDKILKYVEEQLRREPLIKYSESTTALRKLIYNYHWRKDNLQPDSIWE